MWSNPDAPWNGFEAAEYVLDPRFVLELPLDSQSRSNDIESEIPTTIGALLKVAAEIGAKTLAPSLPVFGGDGATALTLSTDRDDLVIPCSSFASQVASLLLALHLERIDFAHTSWFWFDSDSVTDNPHDRHSFFLVHGSRIVREQVTFNDHSHSGFEPRILTTLEEPESTWFGDKGWAEARVRFWYRKFYREIEVGQMMVLRPDEPELFHYPEGQILRLLLKSPQTPIGLSIGEVLARLIIEN